MHRWGAIFAVALACGAPLLACSSSSTTPTGGPVGGAASGVADTHCSVPTKIVTVVDPAACQPSADDAGVDATSDADADADTDADADAGADAITGDAATSSEFGETRYGSEADDDDCKYHVKWSASPIRRGAHVTFVLDVTTRADEQPAAGAAPDAEVFLDSTHPAPNSGQSNTETAPGRYTIGPIVFDASGRWTVRFHLHEDCADELESSPHGHVAFYVDVP